MCSAKWEMTSLKSTDVLERISCSIANMTLEQIPLCKFFLFQTGNDFVKFLFSLGYGTMVLIFVFNVVRICCIVNVYYGTYIQHANQKIFFALWFNARLL